MDTCQGKKFRHLRYSSWDRVDLGPPLPCILLLPGHVREERRVSGRHPTWTCPSRKNWELLDLCPNTATASMAEPSLLSIVDVAALERWCLQQIGLLESRT
jgi:hypothetical protein